MYTYVFINRHEFDSHCKLLYKYIIILICIINLKKNVNLIYLGIYRASKWNHHQLSSCRPYIIKNIVVIIIIIVIISQIILTTIIIIIIIAIIIIDIITTIIIIITAIIFTTIITIIIMMIILFIYSL